METKNKIILIASGGLDSTVLYYYLRSKSKKVEIINFNYGSKHNTAERSRLRQNIGAKIYEVDMDLSFIDSSSLLKGGDKIPEGHYQAESMKSTVVPFRNGIMLSYAVALADSLKYEAVAFGNHSGDHFIYPDCRETFTRAMNEAAAYGTFNNINIISPFNLLSKAKIVEIGKELKIEAIMFNTWTCYNGRDLHCGVCGACVERREAFALNKIIDRTIYES